RGSGSPGVPARESLRGLQEAHGDPTPTEAVPSAACIRAILAKRILRVARADALRKLNFALTSWPVREDHQQLFLYPGNGGHGSRSGRGGGGPGGLPHLRSAIPDPAQEGEESVAFAGMRKSERQVYRVLSNVHYEHLDALLRSLDFCIGRGFTHPTILR